MVILTDYDTQRPAAFSAADLVACDPIGPSKTRIFVRDGAPNGYLVTENALTIAELRDAELVRIATQNANLWAEAQQRVTGRQLIADVPQRIADGPQLA